MSPAEDRETNGFRETGLDGGEEAGSHPLLPYLIEAFLGHFPPADGGFTRLPPLDEGFEAVVSFTGHAVLCTRIGTDGLAGLGVDGFGAALHPGVLLAMAGPGGEVGVIDVTLVARGRGGSDLAERSDLDHHPRVRHARALRHRVRVFGDERGLVTLGVGLGGRLEMSVEASVPGAGRGLILEALGLTPDGQAVFAAVSPGNARSLRAFLASGFQPVASEVIIRPM